RNGRYFYDLEESAATKLFTKVGFTIEKMWITGDVREGRSDEKWINILARDRAV
ncbi:MAG: class I SAM-dependent methyltransferase, partial [Cellulosilyticum sp.]|nr:class I SAM-dependent methyltransferase [Cellulosilyticum sp.]